MRPEDIQLMAACDYAAIGGQIVILHEHIRHARYNMIRMCDMLECIDYPFVLTKGYGMISINDGHIVFRGVESRPENTIRGTNRIVTWARDSFCSISSRSIREWTHFTLFQSLRYEREVFLFEMIHQSVIDRYSDVV